MNFANLSTFTFTSFPIIADGVTSLACGVRAHCLPCSRKFWLTLLLQDVWFQFFFDKIAFSWLPLVWWLYAGVCIWCVRRVCEVIDWTRWSFHSKCIITTPYSTFSSRQKKNCINPWACGCVGNRNTFVTYSSKDTLCVYRHGETPNKHCPKVGHNIPVPIKDSKIRRTC
jgi:hypothetical protein